METTIFTLPLETYGSDMAFYVPRATTGNYNTHIKFISGNVDNTNRRAVYFCVILTFVLINNLCKEI
jgi:hypothetical protein